MSRDEAFSKLLILMVQYYKETKVKIKIIKICSLRGQHYCPITEPNKSLQTVLSMKITYDLCMGICMYMYTHVHTYAQREQVHDRSLNF